MRITPRFKLACKMAKEAGIKEVSVSTGMWMERTLFVSVKIKHLLKMPEGESFRSLNRGRLETAADRMEQAGRVQYKNIWKYLENLDTQETLNL